MTSIPGSSRVIAVSRLSARPARSTHPASSLRLRSPSSPQVPIKCPGSSRALTGSPDSSALSGPGARSPVFSTQTCRPVPLPFGTKHRQSPSYNSRRPLPLRGRAGLNTSCTSPPCSPQHAPCACRCSSPRRFWPSTTSLRNTRERPSSMDGRSMATVSWEPKYSIAVREHRTHQTMTRS